MSAPPEVGNDQAIPKAEPTTPKPSLARKLAEVMGAVQAIPKTGKHTQGYAFAKTDDHILSVRAELAKRLVIIVPSVTNTEWREVHGSKGVIPCCVLTVRFTAHDGESGEIIEFDGVGESMDSGDKATSKATTFALKNALKSLFLIPTGDQPAKERGEPEKQSKREPAPKAEPPPPTNWDRIKELGKKYGKEGKELGSVVVAATKKMKTAEMTDEDVRQVESALIAAVSAEKPKPKQAPIPEDDGTPEGYAEGVKAKMRAAGAAGQVSEVHRLAKYAEGLPEDLQMELAQVYTEVKEAMALKAMQPKEGKTK